MTQSNRNEGYLTKRILKQATAKGFRDASKNAVDVADSVVVVKDGWLVKRFKNGKVVKIKKLPKIKPSKIVLD